MVQLTEIQTEVMEKEAHQAGLTLAQTMGGYGALGGLAIGGMYAQRDDKPILAGIGLVTGLVVGLVGGYFTASAQAKKQFSEDPSLIPVKSFVEEEINVEDFVPPGFEEGFAW